MSTICGARRQRGATAIATGQDQNRPLVADYLDPREGPSR
jgi:hypothetical protein